jgi:hypothetical protein
MRPHRACQFRSPLPYRLPQSSDPLTLVDADLSALAQAEAEFAIAAQHRTSPE